MKCLKATAYVVWLILCMAMAMVAQDPQSGSGSQDGKSKDPTVTANGSGTANVSVRMGDSTSTSSRGFVGTTPGPVGNIPLAGYAPEREKPRVVRSFVLRTLTAEGVDNVMKVVNKRKKLKVGNFIPINTKDYTAPNDDDVHIIDYSADEAGYPNDKALATFVVEGQKNDHTTTPAEWEALIVKTCRPTGTNRVGMTREDWEVIRTGGFFGGASALFSKVLATASDNNALGAASGLGGGRTTVQRVATPVVTAYCMNRTDKPWEFEAPKQRQHDEPPPPPTPTPTPAPSPAATPAQDLTQPTPSPTPTPQPEHVDYCKGLPSSTTHFRIDSDVVEPTFRTKSFSNLEDSNFEAVIQYLRATPKCRVQVQGHTCILGTPKHNNDLGMRRAENVIKWLKDHGAPPEQLAEPASLGENIPATEVTIENNRRVILMPMGEKSGK